jgi:glycosyltransferase involved in cell wall biosynthesis
MTVSTTHQPSFETTSTLPLVSVIIPTYNRPDYLKEALTSVVRQTYSNLEIIVSDNCSPENPQPLVESLQDDRIRLIRNEQNLGLITNTMNAFKQTQGTYVVCVNDDDQLEPDFLAKLVPPLETNPELVIAFSDHYMVDAAGEIDRAETEKFTRKHGRDRLQEGIYQPYWTLGLVGGPVAICSTVIRRSAVNWNEVPTEVGGAWDMYVHFLCARTGKGAYYCPDRLMRYRVHPQSHTSSYSAKNTATNIQRQQSHVLCYEHFLADDRLTPSHPPIHRAWAHAMTSIGINLIRANRPKEARPYLLQSLTRSPRLRTIAALLLSFTPPILTQRL